MLLFADIYLECDSSYHATMDYSHSPQFSPAIQRHGLGKDGGEGSSPSCKFM